MSEKIIIPIVGMRHSAVFKDLTHDQANDASGRLLEGISKGERVLLMAEDDNPVDPHAVISYMRGDFYGWVKAALKNIVRMLMKDNQVEARYVCGSHVTYFVEVETKGPLEPQWEKLYSMDGCPLNDKIVASMPCDERRIAAEESEFRKLLAELNAAETEKCGDIDSNEVTKLRDKFLDCAQRMVESLGRSLSRESELALSFVATSLMMLVADPKSKEWGGERLEKLAEKAERKAADSTRDTGEAIFKAMHDSAIKDTRMLAVYERAVGCKIADMTSAKKKKCAKTLKDWLGTMTTLYDLLTPLENGDWKKLAAQIKYLAIARTDLYRVMAVVALVEKLEEKKEDSSYKGRKDETLFDSEDENREMAKEFLASLPKGTELELNSKQDNPLTIEAIKFARKYKGRKYGDPALIRFLTDYCKVESTVLFDTMKSIMGKIRKNL
ncbi:MAG: hypothetical protein ACI3Y0_08770 [Prevotella sp.]